MCMGCWEEFGKPSIVNQDTQECAELIDKVYEHHSAGGGLHVVLDDWNLEDANVVWCSDEIRKPEYLEEYESSKDRQLAELECVDKLRAMTFEERASALAIHNDFIQSGIWSTTV